MKIVVTGGAGFIGSNTCEDLVHNGHHVICLDNFLTGKVENIPVHDNCKFIKCDVNNYHDLSPIMCSISLNIMTGLFLARASNRHIG